MGIDAGEIQRRLRLKYPVPKWATVFEVRNGLGFNSNGSLDFMAVATWPSLGKRIVGIEVKVTKADFRRELATPQKRAWAEDSCTEFWFAAPRGVIDVEELPEGAGLMETSGAEQMRCTRAAVQRQGNDLTSELWTVLLRRVVEERDREAQAFAERSSRFAMWAGKPIGLGALADLVEKVGRVRGRPPNEYEIYKVTRDARNDAKSWAHKWMVVHQRIGRIARDSGFKISGFNPEAEDIDAFLAAIEGLGDAASLAKRLRAAAAALEEACDE